PVPGFWSAICAMAIASIAARGRVASIPPAATRGRRQDWGRLALAPSVLAGLCRQRNPDRNLQPFAAKIAVDRAAQFARDVHVDQFRPEAHLAGWRQSGVA